MNVRKTIRNYLELSRLFGAINPISAILIGALASTVGITLIDVVVIILIGILAHAYVESINDYCHLGEDSNDPEFQYRPLVSGEIKPKNALIFSLFCFIFTVTLSVIFYPKLLPLIFILLAALFGTIYTIKGKYIPWAYDFSASIGAGFLVLYGATLAGDITMIAVILSIIVFLVAVYGEWIGAMKDVDIDRKFNVPTTAVRWGYTHDKPLTLRDPNLQYFIGILIALDIFYLLPVIYNLVSQTYLYIFLVIGIPTQFYLIYRLFGIQNKDTIRKHPYIFLSSMIFLAFALLIDKITIYVILAIMVFIVIWVYVFSLIGIRYCID